MPTKSTVENDSAFFVGGKEENMKKRKSIGFRWIGNRTVIGIVCIIAAIGICFGIAPTVQKLSAGKTKILRVTRTVPRGSCLTEADVEAEHKKQLKYS